MPDPGDIAAIVLAAGRARRFGADKLAQPLTLQGVTAPLLAHALRPWLQTCDTVTVVVQPHAAPLQAAVEQALADAACAIRWLPCAAFAQGMGHSLAAGIAAHAAAAGWLVGLGDMPCIPLPAIAGVRQALAEGALLAAPWYAGRRGHPAGFAQPCRAELLALRGDAGARALFEAHAGQMARVVVNDPGIFYDIDRPDDVRAFHHREESIA